MNIISVGTELEIKGLRVAFFIPGMQNGQKTYHLPSFGSAVELDSNHLEIISDVTASIIPFRYNTHLTIMIVREIHRQLKNDKSGTTKHIVTGLYKTTVDKETLHTCEVSKALELTHWKILGLIMDVVYLYLFWLCIKRYFGYLSVDCDDNDLS